jgi:type IV pilus assembly protein PilA
MNKRQKGFSLIELLIVVAIILIIAAIAIPNLLRSRMAANEASAVGSVRTLVTSEVTYSSTWGVGFTDLSELGGTCGAGVSATSTTACLIDPVLAAGTKSGYILNAVHLNGTLGSTTSPPTGFVAVAYPVATGSSGQRSFCSDESGVVRYDPTGTAPSTGSECATTLAALQ